MALLPDPDEVDEWDDLGDVTVTEPEAPQSAPEAPRGPTRYVAAPEEPEGGSGGPGPVADPPPGHSRKNWARQERRAASPRPAQTAAVRLTGKVRNDINSKISLVLEVPGRVWAAKDPLCGGTFVEQRPEIADALTEIVCGSPDLVAWFSGSGGQFMLWLNLLMAVAPVGQVVAAHHVYHSVEDVADAQQPDYQSYAA